MIRAGMKCKTPEITTRTTSDITDLHTWLSKNGTNERAVDPNSHCSATTGPHHQLCTGQGSPACWLSFLGLPRFPQPQVRRFWAKETCPGTMLFHSLVSAEGITRGSLPPAGAPAERLARGRHSCLSAWPSPVPPAASASRPGWQGFPVLVTAARGHEAQALSTCEVGESRYTHTTRRDY